MSASAGLKTPWRTEKSITYGTILHYLKEITNTDDIDNTTDFEFPSTSNVHNLLKR